MPWFTALENQWTVVCTAFCQYQMKQSCGASVRFSSNSDHLLSYSKNSTEKAHTNQNGSDTFCHFLKQKPTRRVLKSSATLVNRFALYSENLTLTASLNGRLPKPLPSIFPCSNIGFRQNESSGCPKATIWACLMLSHSSSHTFILQIRADYRSISLSRSFPESRSFPSSSNLLCSRSRKNSLQP